jgi:glutamine amidotransferase-like uncharacterized protein
MPGGADLPYVSKLKGEGNRVIKKFVQKGGSYLGICAGSYYGSGYVEFDKGGDLEVLGKRELAFFPGKAIGPILATYDYKNHSGARAADIKIHLDGFQQVNLYFNGGGFFEDAENHPNVSVIGSYKTNIGRKLPAIIHIPYGKGRVILSGVHFEYEPVLLDSSDQYLGKILPGLEKDNAIRLTLARELLRKLNLSI